MPFFVFFYPLFFVLQWILIKFVLMVFLKRMNSQSFIKWMEQ
ncbi:hypothetical protein L289_3608 [Acinetobacter gerneri DSM 14967 = CIP 107464 = MTCC 9824]|nr:hypothetical protein L289_3608 [Acinetobacter gerneri DSM 14967 = CIP 107464 = MTCC 9824]